MLELIIEEQLANSKLYKESKKTQGCPAQLSNMHLANVNLSEAYLHNAEICESNLRNSNLSYADLSWANLSNSNLTYACLNNTDLSNSNLTGTNLSNVDLREAKLNGAIGLGSITQATIDIIIQLANIVVITPKLLNMESVHSCDTIHCAAGWICSFNPVARTLETMLGWNAAACLVCPIPEFTKLFYSSDKEMLDFLMSTYCNNGQSLKDKYLIN